MLSKNQIKLIRSLELKKNRRREGLFVAEGPKVVGDLLRAGYRPHSIYATTEQSIAPIFTGDGHVNLISDDELRRISFLQHPQEVLAVFPIPTSTGTPWQEVFAADELSLALDGIQDPGNLGTIIRIADWFGIGTIYCSPDTADAYNPKVVQATMGSLAHVRVVYGELRELFDALPADYPVYGTLLNGDDIYQQPLTANGIIVMGNEGNGISADIRRRVNRRLLIPHFQHDTQRAESLNVAIATAITCSEFRRRS